ncbi:MAG: PD-(D/E)XK nuclease family protein [Candidatus Omnitrophica bacterium]|nr:PD-(D/E)XK nuclease family protein [Candidatus Omnitrophota bacterium]
MKRIMTYSFGEDLIEKLADYIINNFKVHAFNFSKVAVVFGGRRPSLFLKRRLAEKINSAYYPPQFFGIDEFCHYIVSKTQIASSIEELDACYRIYEIAKKKVPNLIKGKNDFSSFIGWAREILAFIDEVDAEQISEKALKNIQDNAEIGYEVPKSINELLANIILIKNLYHSQLKKEGLFSKGTLMLCASKQVEKLSFEEFDKILFCGFFDMDTCQKKIIKHLLDKDKAIIFFQSSPRDWPQLEELSAYFDCKIEPDTVFAPNYKLNLYAGFDVHSQVGIVRQIIHSTKEKDSSVIVLPDAHALIPLVSEISSVCEEFNVSMGYPLQRSTLYGLFNCIIDCQNTRKQAQYYSRDYLKLLKHPFIKNLKITSDAIITRIIVHKLEDLLTGKEENKLGGSLFIKLESIETLSPLYELVSAELKNYDLKIRKDDIEELLKQLHKYSFNIWENISTFGELSSALSEFLDILVSKSFLNIYPLNLSVAQKIYDIAESFSNMPFANEKFTARDIFRIFDDKLKTEKISFSGVPLKGLQVLGLFETRSLDFENVIVMDTNESILPRLKVSEPLIPRAVMMSLGINRLEAEDAIQRYHFLRLVSSAKNVHLVYDGSAEKQYSRFIEEIIWDREKKAGTLNVVPVAQAGFNLDIMPENIAVGKSEQMVKLLEDFTFSASSINTYLNCPLQFYYQYVLALSEQEDLLEEPESKQIGTFLHKLLEDTYRKFLNTTPDINETFRAKFFNEFEKRFDAEFKQRMRSDSFMLNYIMRYRLEKFLDKEQCRQQNIKQLLGLEHDIEDTINLCGREVAFRCKIDRVEKLVDNSILVIDYKSGGIEAIPKSFLKLRSIRLEREEIASAVQSFQLPLYLHFMRKKHPDVPINACLYSLKSQDMAFFPREKETQHIDEIMQICQDALSVIWKEIINPGIPFAPVSNTAKNCTFCEFARMCR